LETDGEHNALHIFADRAENFAKYGEPTLVFGAGEHRVGKIELKSHDRVFVHRDAIVHGSFYAKGATDIRIFGNGIVDGGWETRKSMHCYENYTNGCAKFYECTDITLDGVVFRDSAIWVVNLFDCEDVSLKNIKLVGHYKYNTDGVDIVNSRRVSISDCFIRSFDDAITLKGILQYKDKCVEDIHVENTICWCGWGRTLEIGLETVAPAYRRISFTDCDLIHNSAVALDIRRAILRNFRCDV
ncbi:MAG: glycosyl hydrolase family 28 protein, partial [Candidatus Borkfalkia sp.]